ncbi:hypothetical protein UFOVP1037_18 [uncultured Caudovirales phage]|uniref:Uncharacterized protein n=1 Tax=uncultured Caudovirales phage TaxID=2100421 RepID=A0A6J5QFV0_9CAUD|nr:hypothetical protein UFOVP287_23 [uncultured Caudovirales phage]CAB4174169.1 hypothetical protein UFOVP969_29 [uncultured Caudovirales phage]CAB4180371.1 hypothetical protein UFOVP1037_18 [uncultured Caudovirales phage]CAB4194002.1 hypothetical protein UFOVP1250_20 [uncultured Caudovirales phage]
MTANIVTAENILTFAYLIVGIILVPTFFISVLADAVYRKEKKCSSHPSQRKSNTY